jgi:RNA polymerase sigma-70 factor (ECF subfamily)
MAARAIPADLFDAARLGDRAAIDRLIGVAQPDVRRYARAACRSSADAEDAAQEALWLLSRHVGSIRSLSAFAGWLFTVVRRECLRLARWTRLTATEPAPEPAVDLTRRPEAELRLSLVAAIEALPPHYREITLMRDMREMTIDEIAAERGMTRQAVKAQLHRARLLLREYLTR